MEIKVDAVEPRPVVGGNKGKGMEVRSGSAMDVDGGAGVEEDKARQQKVAQLDNVQKQAIEVLSGMYKVSSRAARSGMPEGSRADADNGITMCSHDHSKSSPRFSFPILLPSPYYRCIKCSPTSPSCPGNATPLSELPSTSTPLDRHRPNDRFQHSILIRVLSGRGLVCHYWVNWFER